MKNQILIAAFLLMSAISGMAQTKVTKDAQGNYVVAKRTDTATNKPTGHTITDKDGVKHPVYISIRGKLYYLRTSKAGNVYKNYIKED